MRIVKFKAYISRNDSCHIHIRLYLIYIKFLNVKIKNYLKYKFNNNIFIVLQKIIVNNFLCNT